MGLKIVTGNISEFSCDVVINSLGVITTTYGGICASIVERANSPELSEIIKRANDVYDVGEYFFTEGFGLPVQSICHLITPRHDNDDQNLNILIYSIKSVLMSCMKLNYKTIAIPLVGAGHNGYSDIEVFSVLRPLCHAFCEFFKEMQVTIVLPDDPKKYMEMQRMMNSFGLEQSEEYASKEIEKYKKSTKYFKDYYDYGDKVIEFNKSFFLKLSSNFGSAKGFEKQNVSSISNYISEYIDCKYGSSSKKARKNVYTYLGYGKPNPLESGINTFKKLKISADKATFYKLILATKMTVEEATEFLNFFGFALCYEGINKSDDVIRELLKKHVYGILEANTLFIAKEQQPLFK